MSGREPPALRRSAEGQRAGVPGTRPGRAHDERDAHRSRCAREPRIPRARALAKDAVGRAGSARAGRMRSAPAMVENENEPSTGVEEQIPETETKGGSAPPPAVPLFDEDEPDLENEASPREDPPSAAGVDEAERPALQVLFQ